MGNNAVISLENEQRTRPKERGTKSLEERRAQMGHPAGTGRTVLNSPGIMTGTMLERATVSQGSRGRLLRGEGRRVSSAKCRLSLCPFNFFDFSFKVFKEMTLCPSQGAPEVTTLLSHHTPTDKATS